MANSLSCLMPTLFAALDIVSREIVGFIPAVSVNAAPNGVAKGDPIKIPVTQTAESYDVVPGAAPGDNGDQEVACVTMTIQKSKYAPVRWTGEEQLSVSNAGVLNTVLRDQFAQAMRVLVNEAEQDIASCYKEASRAYGTAGTTPFAAGVTDVAQVRKILVDNGAPLNDLQLVVDTAAGANLRANTQLTKANEAGTDATLRRGELLQISGMSIRESAGIRPHVAGSFTGDAVVNNSGGYKPGANIVAYDGASAADFKAGDIVTFADDNNKYVINKAGTVSPLTLNLPGLRSAVADDAAVTLGKAYTPNLAFDRNAIQAIFRTPAVPQGGDMADDRTVITDPVSGLSFDVSVYRQYKQVKYEVGLAWGWKCIKPEHVAILLG